MDRATTQDVGEPNMTLLRALAGTALSFEVRHNHSPSPCFKLTLAAHSYLAGIRHSMYYSSVVALYTRRLQRAANPFPALCRVFKVQTA